MSTPEASNGAPALAERYRVLLEIGRTLAGTLGREELYHAIHRETARVLEASGFYISLYDADNDQAAIVFYADRGTPRLVDIAYRGSDSDVIRTGEPSLVEDRVSDGSVPVGADDPGEITRSSISVPLRYEDRILGAISIQSYRPRAYTKEHLALLTGIADLAAVAVENARHVSELDRRRQEAEKFEEIGRALAASLDPEEVLTQVTEACLVLIEADGAAVWLVSGDRPLARVAASAGEVVVPVGSEWTLDGPVGDRLLVDREPLIIEDLAASPLVPEGLRDVLERGTGLAVPLLVNGEVAGVLSVGRRIVRRFSDEDTRVLQRLARQASLALENARQHTDLQTLSLTDPLTGLANRRHLQMHLQKEIAAASRGRSVSVVMFDLDDLKLQNDTHGHPAGDEILRAFSRILAEENRVMNLVARYGGDEFVSVLSDSRREGARQYVGRVSSRVALDKVLSRYGVTASAGIATFDRVRMATGEDLLSTADAALYRSKAERRRSKASAGASLEAAHEVSREEGPRMEP